MLLIHKDVCGKAVKKQMEIIMKKILGIAAIALLIVPSAFAQPQFGIGWDDGYSIRMRIEQFNVQATGKFDSVFPEDDDLDTETDAEISIYGGYALMDYNEAQLNGFVGFSLMPTSSQEVIGNRRYDKEMDFGFRFGIEPEVMITDNVGLSSKLGFEIELDEGYEDLNDSGSTKFGSWGSVGVHWYF